MFKKFALNYHQINSFMAMAQHFVTGLKDFRLRPKCLRAEFKISHSLLLCNTLQNGKQKSSVMLWLHFILWSFIFFLLQLVPRYINIWCPSATWVLYQIIILCCMMFPFSIYDFCFCKLLQNLNLAKVTHTNLALKGLMT